MYEITCVIVFVSLSLFFIGEHEGSLGSCPNLEHTSDLVIFFYFCFSPGLLRSFESLIQGYASGILHFKLKMGMTLVSHQL